MKRLLFTLIPILLTAMASAQSYQGYLDGANCGSILGWAWDSTQPNTPINVDLYDGSITGPKIATVSANQYRDLAPAGIGNGYHAFNYPTPPSLKNSQNHTVVAVFGGTQIQEHTDGPSTVNCTAGSTGYQYYYSALINPPAGWDSLVTINTNNWYQVGNASGSSAGLTSSDSNGGSIISKVGVPGGNTQYEVRTIHGC